MPRYRLRYQATDLELPVGEFVVGRSSSCNLALDDALVSRRHAIFRATEERVSVEDLGSRNGVLVNGERIRGLVQIKHLDRVTIGSQELTLIEIGAAARVQRDTTMVARCGTCGTTLQPSDSFCRSCGTPVIVERSTLAGQTLEIKLPQAIDPEDNTQQATGFSLLTGIADKALALGRYDEAQRILEKHLERLVERARHGEHPNPKSVQVATSYALKIARGLGSARWIDWVFAMHTAIKTVPSVDTVDTLHELVREVHYGDARALREFLTAMRPARERLSASERFVLSRLEGLERVISA